jgi:hypothetical protein
LLTAAPLFAGVSEPIAAPAPQANCEQGWTLGLEALALRPFQSEGEYDENNFDFGYRASVGYQFNDGLFTKLTYFGYKGDTYSDSGRDSDGYGDYSYDDNAEVEVSYLDLVIGQNFKPSEALTLSPFVGLRWATFEESGSYKENYDNNQERPYYATDTYKSKYSDEFSGLGIVVGIDATRSFGNSFSLYGTAKQSVVFGSYDHSSNWSETYVDDSPDSGDDDYSGDSVAFITELGLGVQYDFSFSNVAANIRAGVEGQYWAGLSSEDSENTGLAGFVLGANFRF